MSVFVSYKRENLDRVRDLVAALRAEGLDVWWDQDIPPHAPWESTIEARLTAAKVVVVCWSKAAVASENVRAEARLARAENRLIQVFIEACAPPLFFGERQGVDLSHWYGDSADPNYRALASAIQALIDGKQPDIGIVMPAAGRKSGGRAAIAATVVITVIGAVFGWQALSNRTASSVQAAPQSALQPASSAQLPAARAARAPIVWNIQPHIVDERPTPGAVSLKNELDESLRDELRQIASGGANANVVEIALTVDGVHGAEGRFQGRAAVSMGRRGRGPECPTFPLSSRGTLAGVADDFANEIIGRAELLMRAEGEAQC